MNISNLFKRSVMNISDLSMLELRITRFPTFKKLEMSLLLTDCE
jgi:hypothetical protein